jgi:acetyl esterase
VPLEDCYAATEWVAKNASELGVDAHRIAITGASAGGNLAAGVTLLARERGGPAICGQVLLVPAVDPTLSSPSIQRNGTGFDLTQESMVAVWDLYLGRDVPRTDPLAGPLHHPDLSGLPPAHVVVAEFDPLHDEGLAYARRLAEAGVPTTVGDFAMTHSLVAPDVAVTYVSDMLDAIRRLTA